MQASTVVLAARLHQQAGDLVFDAGALTHQQVAEAQHGAQLAQLGRQHPDLGEQPAAQHIGQRAGIDAIALLLGCGNGLEPSRMRHLEILGPIAQMIVDPGGEQRRLHASDPGLRQLPAPDIERGTGGSHGAFLQDVADRRVDAVTDGLLVNIESDVVH